jgi:uncharacterized protein (DUF2141 family)
MVRNSLAIALLLLTAAPSVRAGEVFLVLEGLESGDGEVQVDLFAEAHAANFPYADRGVQSEIRTQATALLERGASIALGDLAPGRYALFAMHDANGNGDLDRNLLGIPTEGYGFSNGATGTIGPPSFDAAAVQVGADGPTRIVIRLAH